ncbi:hypothetical protein ABZ820_34830 [Streptomyces diacarni]|uniref:hypothetical protein n=1 Tax=Streptomyces diacarni TaxID=2800381 RepID=UPI0033DA0134
MTAPLRAVRGAVTTTGRPRLHFRIELPAGMALINANHRMHNRQRAQLTRQLRDAATLACRADRTVTRAIRAARGGPVFDLAWIVGVLHPSTRGRCDPANWYGSFKAAVDGLVNAGLLEDDDDQHVIGPDMRRGPVVRGGQIVLHVFQAFPDDHWQALR